MKAIVAVSDNWGIGNDNELLFHIPEDMKFFKDMTSGHSVVMGHNTYESIGKPLPNRKNYVLSRDTSLSIDGVTVIHDISQIPDDSFVIGGESIYGILLKYCDTVFVTKIHRTKKCNKYFDIVFLTKKKKKKKCNKYFPNLDEKSEWKIISKKSITTSRNEQIDFITYKKEK